MKMRFISLAALGLASFMLSACKQENTPTQDLISLVTPQISVTANGEVNADRLLVIPYQAEQSCTSDLTTIIRLNPHNSTIEMCVLDEWMPSFKSIEKIISVDNVDTKTRKKK